VRIELGVGEYFLIGFAFVLLARTIHYLAVTRYLREHGIVAATEGATIRDWAEWSAYRKARITRHESLTWWYFLWFTQVFLLFWLAGWFAFAGGAIKLGKPSHFVDTTADSDGYRTVFDVAQVGYRHWPFALSGLIFVALGFALPALIRSRIIRTNRPNLGKWFSRIFVIGGTLWTAATLAGTFVQYRQVVDALQTGRAKIVEGRVEHFAQVPTKSESFDVNGVKFWYSDNVVIAGFNHTAYLGGPIREGLPVKIWYWNGQILRLQIKTEQ
jgi:hypothetical protein